MSKRKKRQQVHNEIIETALGPKLFNRFKPRTINQTTYYNIIQQKDVIFCLGPAGTGKTAVSVGAACEYLSRGEIDRIIITRPVVEVGKGLGFLPGTAMEKVEIYMIPVLEELDHYLGRATVANLMRDKIISIEPLEYMRGRNFHNSFMIVDEVQNITLQQIKMALTRLGTNSKIVLSGDPNQCDLKDSGLDTCIKKLKGLDGVGIVNLDKSDIQRNGIIGSILDRLEND